jgi:hypothetical protein
MHIGELRPEFTMTLLVATVPYVVTTSFHIATAVESQGLPNLPSNQYGNELVSGFDVYHK